MFIYDGPYCPACLTNSIGSTAGTAPNENEEKNVVAGSGVMIRWNGASPVPASEPMAFKKL
jgi:hypothetical protein